MAIKCKIIFDDWRIGGKSVYSTRDGCELSLGSLHSGTTFDCKVKFGDDEKATIEEAKKKGINPTFILVLDD
jgi:hypothetical protein